MANTYFRFKQFVIHQCQSRMKVTTDSCLFGAWVAEQVFISGLHDARILDIGTGTGLLSLMIAQKNKCKIDAIEIDDAAAQEAQENVSASKWKYDISVVHADILEWVPVTKYDVIVCNPPFYETDLTSPDLRKNIAHHSHNLTLAELLVRIKALMTANCACFVLLPFRRKDETTKLFQENNFFINNEVVIHPAAKNSAFRLMLQFSRHNSPTEKSHMYFKEENTYSERFIQLLKDYYLYL